MRNRFNRRLLAYVITALLVAGIVNSIPLINSYGLLIPSFAAALILAVLAVVLGEDVEISSAGKVVAGTAFLMILLWGANSYINGTIPLLDPRPPALAGAEAEAGAQVTADTASTRIAASVTAPTSEEQIASSTPTVRPHPPRATRTSLPTRTPRAISTRLPTNTPSATRTAVPNPTVALEPTELPTIASSPTRVANNGCAAQVRYGETIACTLSSGEDMHSYRFNANSNDIILISVVRTSDQLDPYFQVMNPQGGTSSGCDAGGDDVVEKDCTLSSGGTHTIVVRDRWRQNSGGYTITLHKLNSPEYATVTQYGPTINSAIIGTAERDYFSFEAAVDDVVLFSVVRLTGTLDPEFRVYYANGSNVANCEDGHDEIAEEICVLPSAGRYTVRVADRWRSGAGDYSLTIQRLNNPAGATPITYGQPVPGDITRIAERDFYTFLAEVDDEAVITVSRNSGTIAPFFRVYDERGVQVVNCEDGNATEAQDICILPTKGAYTVRVSDSNLREFGQYTVLVAKR